MDDALIGAPDDVAEKIIAKIAEGFPGGATGGRNATDTSSVY